MRKLYVGARLRRLRTERGLTQTGMAKMLGMSVSYVNQLENDQRPLSVPVLLRLNATFDLDPTFFSSDADARVVADLQEVLAENGQGEEIGPTEIDEVVARSPAVARALVAMHRRLRAATEQSERLSSRVGDDIAAPSTPYEDVRDYFYDRRNHIAELDEAAEQLFVDRGLRIGGLDLQLARVLRESYDVTVRIADASVGSGPKREFDPAAGVVTLARRLDHGQRAFQLATQIALLGYGGLMDEVLDDEPSLTGEARALARVGLANYFAGALILPYTAFLEAAERLAYDVDLLGERFEVGFETVCHRLSTLQRRGQRGVPFFFVRTDKAGNISKRQSATAFHFSRVGGGCPLWVVHDAFATPGRIRTQVAQMPDGRSYLWIARTTPEQFTAGYLGGSRTFAVGLGCDLAHARHLVYSRGLSLDPETFVPIGPGCKVCDRSGCGQRAFPHLGSSIGVDENRAEALPYAVSPTVR